jgi:hypothetical protein
VYWSQDNGASFEPLPSEATSSPLSGSVTVTFDPDYSDNNTVYAASDSEGESIYRFIIGQSQRWEAIDSPAGGRLGQIIVSSEGTLYANNFKAKLFGLWLAEHRLWSVDSANNRLMTYYDRLSLMYIQGLERKPSFNPMYIVILYFIVPPCYL